MKAILVKYLPATNTRGARLKATDCDHNTLTISYPSDSTHAHSCAALALCRKMGWKGTLVEGGLGDGSSVFTFLDSDHYTI
jgi:ribosomal protein S27E